MADTIRDLMAESPAKVEPSDSIEDAAKKMRENDVGSLLVVEDDELKGIITDRDIVIKAIAEGVDPASMTAEQLAQGKPAYVEANSDISEVLDLMQRRQVKRVPVVEDHRLVGMISEADLARNLPEDKVGHFVEMLTS
jgi:CBS domain-containing protein